MAPLDGGALQHCGPHMIFLVHEHLSGSVLTHFTTHRSSTAGTSKANQCAAPSLHLSGVEGDGPAPRQHPGAPGCQRERAPEGRGIKEAIVLQC